jgi:hypothetical protein
MPENVVEPAGANELPPTQFRALTVLSMQDQMAGVPVGDARLTLLTREHQQLELVVAVHESCYP